MTSVQLMRPILLMYTAGNTTTAVVRHSCGSDETERRRLAILFQTQLWYVCDDVINNRDLGIAAAIKINMVIIL